MAEFQEYPKSLYLDGADRTVTNDEEQEAAEAEGFTDWHSDQARMEDAEAEGKPSKRTRAK